MSAIAIFLWPALGFLVVAALAGLLQARRSSGEAAAAGRRRAAIFGTLAAAAFAWLMVESRT